MGHLKIITRLLDLGLDVNQQSDRGVSALQVAVDNNRVSIVKFLLEKGADCNVVDAHGFTPLLVAVQNDHQEVIPLLLDHGSDQNWQNHEGHTALMLAILKNRGACIQALLTEKVNLSLQDNSGFSVLIMAIDKDQIDLAVRLIKRGHPLIVKTHTGFTPTHYAIDAGNYDLLLLMTGSDARCCLAVLASITYLKNYRMLSKCCFNAMAQAPVVPVSIVLSSLLASYAVYKAYDYRNFPQVSAHDDGEDDRVDDKDSDEPPVRQKPPAQPPIPPESCGVTLLTGQALLRTAHNQQVVPLMTQSRYRDTSTRQMQEALRMLRKATNKDDFYKELGKQVDRYHYYIESMLDTLSSRERGSLMQLFSKFSINKRNIRPKYAIIFKAFLD
ncbi:MAG: ankyrin repeat domain-containing protein [Endozoicomonas sp.]